MHTHTNVAVAHQGLMKWPPAARQGPGAHRQHQDQQTDAGREVAMHHFNPGLAVSHRAVGRRCLRNINRRLGTYGSCMPITSRPIGATEATVGQAGERSEKNQVKSQKQREQSQRLHAPYRQSIALTPGEPSQRYRGKGQADAREPQQGQPIKRRALHVQFLS
jgi:hypothetical protein